MRCLQWFNFILLSAIEDNNPVIYLEHRWIHNVFGEVPEEYYKIPIGEARIATKGSDVTLVSSSYMTLEALRCAEILAKEGTVMSFLIAKKYILSSNLMGLIAVHQ